MKLKQQSRYERYELALSPLAQRPTQKELGILLGEKRDDLRRLVNYKSMFIKREERKIGAKLRKLAYPVNRLRAVHERLKFHLNKVKLPPYLFSPRKGAKTRQNALQHLDQHHYLTIDLKQFYPSTSFLMVRRWLIADLGMYEDVADLLTHLVTIDNVVSFGSPVTPVLVALVHRPKDV